MTYGIDAWNARKPERVATGGPLSFQATKLKAHAFLTSPVI